LISNGWIEATYIANHTNDFAQFAEFIKQFTPEVTSNATGLSVEALKRFALAIHRGERVSFWWTMGVNQGHEATRTAQAIINLALMTDNMGRPGTGANSITGQCNAMGSRLFSNTTNLLGGHEFQNQEHRRKLAGILGIDESCIPSQDSWAYDQIVKGIDREEIKGLWIIGTNASHSWIQQESFNHLIEKLEFLVVQDMYGNTETARRADLVLPAAGWGEKEGTLINSERRIGLVKRVSRAPGQALSDFNIFRLIAQYWGCGEMFSRWTSPEQVFQILKDCSRGQPCDISGIRDYRMLDDCGGIQWPWTNQDSPPAQERRLFEDRKFFHQDQKARFLFDAPRPLPDSPNAEFPLLLLTGRGTSAQWHTQTRTAKSDVLRKLYPSAPYVEVNQRDATQLGIDDGEVIRVISRQGRLEARAFVTFTIQPGQVFIPMHYSETNQLTVASFDPHSRQPAYKSCPVRIERLRS
jgi:assimilatory nitrate reductase catalytic subunit